MARLYSFKALLGAAFAVAFTTLVLSSPAAGWQSPSDDKKANEPKQPRVKQAPERLEGVLDPAWVKALAWRSIGPATMSGRIIDVAVFEKNPSIWWAATASGGLVKTTNNGTTFEHQFDHENTVSIGDVAVSQSDANVVWVGTGEHNPRNSVSYGDGVYKSTNGGKSWQNVGLKDSFQIGRIAIHPTNPNVVYVGALGRLYGPNEERGVYKTADGGKTWERVLFLDDKTGIIDLQMCPDNPDELIAAAWERRRDEFDSHPGSVPRKDGYDGYDPIKKWGPKSGLYKTVDGGQNWKRLSEGLPTCELGRIGIDYYRKNPKVIFAIVDCEKIGKGTPPPATFLGVQGQDSKEGALLARVTPNGPASKAGLKGGDLVKAVNKKPIKNYAALVAQIRARKPGDKLPLTILRDKETKEITVTLGTRPPPPPPPGGFLGLTGTSASGGLRISQVVDKSPAATAGVKVGDLLQTVDKKKIANVNEVIAITRAKKPGDEITLELSRDKNVVKLKVKLGKMPQQARRLPTRPYGALYGGQRENVQDVQGPNSHEYGGVYKSVDGGETWKRINSVNPRPMYFSQIRVDPSDELYVYVLGVALLRSGDGGKTFRPDASRNVHPDQHALWIDPKDGRHAIVGTDGGFYATYDRMDRWDHYDDLALGQFYHVTVDTRMPYRVYGGLQDNGSWGGPSRSLARRGIANHEWFMLGGGDGFICRVDPDDADLVYWESQDGNVLRRHLKTGQFATLKPRPPRGQAQYRFNWQTPFILSHHNPRIVYVAGNYVFRSVNRGEKPLVISPEITRTKRGSATVLAESPRDAQVLYAGTDDGYLWVTRDGGKKWTNVTDKIGLPGPRWVNCIEPSRSKDGRVYVVFDGHRSDDDNPHVFVSEDYGQTWKSLNANLPSGSTRVVREDPKNPMVLYLGTEFFVYASVNRGKSWTKINNNLPTVAIHEIAIHDEMDEIVAATHGRSLWVLDVSALRRSKPSTLDEKVTLFQPTPAIRWRSEPFRGTIYGMGERHFVGQNPPSGATIYYALTSPAKTVKVKVLDVEGSQLREYKASGKPGLHRVQWDLTRLSFRAFGARRRPFSQPVPPGAYRIVLVVDDKEFTTTVRVQPDPTLPANLTTEVEEQPPRKKKTDERLDD